MNPYIHRWHDIVKSRDLQALDDLFDDSLVFHSPVAYFP